jgi:hypothetical protein
MERSMEFTFQQNGPTVTGTTVFAPMGQRPGGGGGRNVPEPQEIAIKDGKMEGDKLTFTVARTMAQRNITITMTFAATVSGDNMEGTLTTSGGMRGSRETTFKGVRKEG